MKTSIIKIEKWNIDFYLNNIFNLMDERNTNFIIYTNKKYLKEADRITATLEHLGFVQEPRTLENNLIKMPMHKSKIAVIDLIKPEKVIGIKNYYSSILKYIKFIEMLKKMLRP